MRTHFYFYGRSSILRLGYFKLGSFTCCIITRSIHVDGVHCRCTQTQLWSRLLINSCVSDLMLLSAVQLSSHLREYVDKCSFPFKNRYRTDAHFSTVLPLLYRMVSLCPAANSQSQIRIEGQPMRRREKTKSAV